MSKKEVLEIRVTFKEDQRKLYEYIKNHSSYAGFLKDLAYREMLRDEAYINNNNNDNNLNNVNPYHYPPINPSINPPINGYPYPVQYTIPQNIDPNLYNQNTNATLGNNNNNNNDDTNNNENERKEKDKKKKSRKVDIDVSELGLDLKKL